MRFKLLSILVILHDLLQFTDGIGESCVVAHTETEDHNQITNFGYQQIDEGIINEDAKLEEICVDKNANNAHNHQDHKDGEQHSNSSSSSHGGHQRRKKRFIFSDLLVSNLISVITGSLANDFTGSSMWDKLTNCFNTVKKQYFLRGWKRCWEYWRLGEQKWRKSLKPHMIGEILRLSAKKLKKLDLQNYNAAMIKIQDEYDKTLLDGSQTMRILNILRDAKLELPDLKWTPIQTNINPGELTIKMLEMDRSKSNFEFKYLLQLYQDVLGLLNKEFGIYFSSMKHLNRPKEELLVELPDFRAKYMHNNENDEIITEQEAMKDAQRQQQATRIIGKIVNWVDGEFLRHPSALNQFFMHSVLIGYAAQMSTNSAMYKNLTKLNGCLLALIKKQEETAAKAEKNNDSEKEEIKKLGRFEGLDKNILEANVQKEAIRKNLKRIKEDAKNAHYDYESGEQKFLSFVSEKYSSILVQIEESAAAGNNVEDQCSYESGILGIEIGEIDEQLRVKMDLGFGEESAEAKILLRIAADLERMLVPLGKTLQAKHLITNRQHIAYRYGKLHQMSDKEVLTLDKLMLQASIALFGYILANDLVTLEKRLNQMTGMLGMGPFDADKDMPGKFRAVVENIMEHIFVLMKIQPTFLQFVFRKNVAAEFVQNEFDKYANEMAIGLPISVISIKRSIVNEKIEIILKEQYGNQQVSSNSGEEAIAIPMRMTKEWLKEIMAKFEYSDTAEHLEVPPSHNGNKTGKKTDKRRRRKRLVEAIVWGLATGWIGNVISQYVDLSRTFRSCITFKCQIVWTEDVLRKQREKGMQNFIARAYKIMIAKLVESDASGNARKQLYAKMRQYLISMVHGQNLAKNSAKDMDEWHIGNILLKLDILDFKDFRHHIESIIENKEMQATVILRVLHDFSTEGWISYETCKKNYERIRCRIDRKQCQNHWYVGKLTINWGDGHLSRKGPNEEII